VNPWTITSFGDTFTFPHTTTTELHHWDFTIPLSTIQTLRRQQSVSFSINQQTQISNIRHHHSYPSSTDHSWTRRAKDKMTEQSPSPHVGSANTRGWETNEWNYILGYNDGIAVGLKEGERNGYEDGVNDGEERAEKRILDDIAQGIYRLPADVLRVQLSLQV
jgi:hypothetical protein